MLLLVTENMLGKMFYFSVLGLDKHAVMPHKVITAEVRQMCECAELDQELHFGRGPLLSGHERPQFLAKDNYIVMAQNDTN